MENAEVELGYIRLTKGGHTAADLTISDGDADVKYNVYLRENTILLQFRSTNRSRAELAARLLRRVGVGAEVRREDGRTWYVWATADKLAAGRRELREALAEVVRKALARGWVGKGTAERWLRKLERGRTVRRGWPKYNMQLIDGALIVRYGSTNLMGIEREARRLREMGLEEGAHFTVKTPEGGRDGYVRILKRGLAYAAWLSIHGSGKQRRLAAEFVGYILQRAMEEGDAVYRKAFEVVEEGKARGSLKLADVRGAEVFVGGVKHVVTVLGGRAEVGRSGSGRPLLRIRITAEIDGVRRECVMTLIRRRPDNAMVSYAYASADAPGGREADAERFSALIKALTGREPKMYRRGDGRAVIMCTRKHLEALARYAELADDIERWLEETSS